MTPEVEFRGVVVAVLIVVTIWASARILVRLGFSPWRAAISWLMPINILGLVVLALVRWPVERGGKRG